MLLGLIKSVILKKHKDTANSREGADPGTAAGPVTAVSATSPPAQSRRCTSPVVRHTPGRAAAQPPAPPRLRTEQSAWVCFLAPLSNATENSSAIQVDIKSPVLMRKSIKCLHRVISSGGILYTLYPLFRSGKYEGICHLAGGSGAATEHN